MELKDLREELNQIDRQLVTLLDRRFEISRRVGQVKMEKGLPILDLKREEEILERNREWLAGSGNADVIDSVYRLIFAESRSLQGEKNND